MASVFAMVTTSRSKEYTPLALRSFFDHTPLSPEDRVVLIDNDGDFELPGDLSTRQIEVVKVERPQSFARNANMALALARPFRADVVLLNNDLVFTSGWFDALRERPESIIASVSNAQYPYSAPGLKLAPVMSLLDFLGHEKDLDEIAQQHRRRARGYQRVASAPFYCVRIPAAAYERIGEFDERFEAGGGENRDYALRAWLDGVPVELALASFVLHFQGRSTWRGGETEAERAARDTRNTQVFCEKWGAALTYALIGDDWNLFLSDPALCEAITRREFGAAIERLRTDPSLDRFVERQQAARFGAVCVVYEDDSWLPFTVEPIYTLCDSIWFLVNDQPWYGEPTDQGPMLERLRRLPDPAGKFRIVQGHWRDEIEPRNEALERLREAGIDYCFVVDADEIWDPSVLASAMKTVRANPQVGVWRAGCFTYWKSHAYRVDPPEPYRAIVFMRVGAGRFTYSRDGVAEKQAVFPIAEVAFHHMSYARSNEVVRRKIDGCTHKFEIVPGWFEDVWLRWDGNQKMENLHPCWPGAYRRVIPQPYEALPPTLRRLRQAEAAGATPKVTAVGQ